MLWQAAPAPARLTSSLKGFGSFVVIGLQLIRTPGVCLPSEARLCLGNRIAIAASAKDQALLLLLLLLLYVRQYASSRLIS
jgi:hypothetical protein